MWFYEQIVASIVEPLVSQPQNDGATVGGKNKVVSVEQNETFELTSSDEDTSTGSSAAPIRPHDTDRGFQVDHLLESAALDNDDTISKATNTKDDTPATAESVEVIPMSFPAAYDVSKTSRASKASMWSRASTASHVSKLSEASSVAAAPSPSTGNVSVEEEHGAIEVEAAGSGFPLSSWEDIKESVTVLSSDASNVESDLKAVKSRRRCLGKRGMLLILALLIVTTACLIAGLAVGLGKNLFQNKSSIQSTAAASNAEEQSEGAAVDSTSQATETPVTNETEAPSTNGDATESSTVDTDHDQNGASWIDDPVATASPTSAQTTVVTAAGTTMPTEISCGDDHNLVVVSECQSEGVESWSYTRVLFCFSRTRDGDWYWIRGADSDYDRWDYTEGASEGMLNFESIPPGNYLVSLVRDSMQPYDVLITENLTIPDCSTA